MGENAFNISGNISGNIAGNILGGYMMQMQNFSVNDGDGIRTNIFLAGCPLRCKWCSNPEGQTLQNKMTRYITVEEVLSHIKKQMIFYRFSGGGVTFSGGEATVQTEFLRILVKELYDMGVNLALETCGYFEFDRVRDILEKMDLLFMDIKHMTDEEHSFFTGKKVSPILENIKKTAALGKQIVIRIPTIIGVNATDENIISTILFIKVNIPQAKLEFLPYHTFGVDKYKNLGMEPPNNAYKAPDEIQLSKWKGMAVSEGINVVSYR